MLNGVLVPFLTSAEHPHALRMETGPDTVRRAVPRARTARGRRGGRPGPPRRTETTSGAREPARPRERARPDRHTDRRDLGRGATRESAQHPPDLRVEPREAARRRRLHGPFPRLRAQVLDPLDLDAARFDSLVRDAKRAMPVDPEVAVDTLEDALALWRGPALADLADQPSLLAEAAPSGRPPARCAGGADRTARRVRRARPGDRRGRGPCSRPTRSGSASGSS